MEFCGYLCQILPLLLRLSELGLRGAGARFLHPLAEDHRQVQDMALKCIFFLVTSIHLGKHNKERLGSRALLLLPPQTRVAFSRAKNYDHSFGQQLKQRLKNKGQTTKIFIKF